MPRDALRADRDLAVEVSVVVPCLDEADSLERLHDGLCRHLADATPSWELVLVDDGSRDGTLEVCRRLARLDPRVRYVSFTRNFGKEPAMLAGLAAARGAWIVLMDADLQHPPAVVPELLDLARQGHDVVTTRRDRLGDPRRRRLTARAYYRLVNRLVDVRLEDGVGDFQVLSRRAVRALLDLPESNRFSKGLLAWVGYGGTTVDIEDAARCAGTSKWSTRRLLDYGIDAVLSFNPRPLRLLLYAGLVVLVPSSAYIAYLVTTTVVQGVAVPGYVTLITAQLLLGGVQLIALGVLGEYVGRIYLETKRRPPYVVRDSNLDADAAAAVHDVRPVR